MTSSDVVMVDVAPTPVALPASAVSAAPLVVSRYFAAPQQHQSYEQPAQQMDSGARAHADLPAEHKLTCAPPCIGDGPILMLDTPAPPPKPPYTAKLRNLLRHFFAAGHDDATLSMLISWLGRQPTASGLERAAAKRVLMWLHEYDPICACVPLADGELHIHNRMSRLS